ncbi:uncharacterized protein GGS22DRAFT_157517 [Annulohypoxylon maeteangense]|uniref:uncharacterized protein n=1 Tax=Annulohypoxylon maeteangense TaxID=1927788 RepID=UPI002007B1DE|nr:uncharacterized protein GGS22DRAFT_157517 [Annulohypoxylon maeteangense]KAI0887577.1 hypothetical protein GGS22DRAFT_157517 [Annulohypoxylon maeteangense]
MDIVCDNPLRKTKDSLGEKKGGKPIWYCCQCGLGPMIINTTPSCIFCNQHTRCGGCDTA